MIDISVDTNQMRRLQDKMNKYPPYAINKGLEAANDYLNSPDVRAGMYPDKEDTPFVWSSDKQRRAYFATNGFGGGIPYVRTMQLYDNAKFVVNGNNYWIEYVNDVPYAKWVQHPSYQIIGHKTRKWPVINKYISSKASKVVAAFKPAVLNAWEELDRFMYSGGAGL
jgi:hypothetical protein